MLPRLNLATLPTPLHRLDELSRRLDVDLWIKRDDLTGFAMGGNKVRETEYLIADALQQKADVVLTAGTYQSNHVRVIAAASQRVGLECHVFLSGSEPRPPTGNFLLDKLLDVKIHHTASREERHPAMESFSKQLEEEGRRPYLIPLGGANAIGASGYVSAFKEMNNQIRQLSRKPAVLVFASSTGTTHAGLLVGRLQAKAKVQILGIRTDLDPDPQEVVCRIANGLAELLGLKGRIKIDDVELNGHYVGEDFGVQTRDGTEALRLLWRLEGILLEPVYTAKTMAGLIDLAGTGIWKKQRVVFLHTGGTPATFSFAETLFQY
jgi:L-cysteate sulfo-lyase